MSFYTETVVIELLKSKCMTILYYGLEVYPLNKPHIMSIDYALTSCLKKTFCTNSQEIISQCCDIFHCLLAEDVIAKRKKKFLLRFVNSGISFVVFLANVNSRSRSLYAVARPSVCRLSSVCLSVVCLSVVCNARALY